MRAIDTLLSDLVFLYGEEAGRATCAQVGRLIARSQSGARYADRSLTLDSRDAILITYGDQVQQPGEPPLQTLNRFCSQYLTGLVSGVHILPFYPYSSDDGFSVIDYRRVDPALGSWQDIQELRQKFRLMFDAVINHVSAQSAWFQGFLAGEPPYRDYFISVTGSPDLSQVVRPRTLPLLTRFSTRQGERAVWTTFSADQVDLNYQNPQALLEILDILLFYARQGADFIRLDAIAYLWKELGTACIHLPQTHAVIRIIHAVLEEGAPQARLISETNVPHAENMSYFGNGADEAHLIYNFALPPLVLYTLQHGDARPLSAWARQLSLPSRQVTFFNFLASHDGIGLTPLRGILPDLAIDELARRTLAQGGLVSYRSNPDGSQSPYELNINYFDALAEPDKAEPLELHIARFSAAHAIQLSLVGLPGVYFHSLFGSRGWAEGARVSGHNRAINRQKLTLEQLEQELCDPSALRSRVFSRLTQLLRARASHPAFQPYGDQQALDCGAQVFALLRGAAQDGGQVLCLQNVSARTAWIDLPGRITAPNGAAIDLLSGEKQDFAPGRALSLAPYQTSWLVL